MAYLSQWIEWYLWMVGWYRIWYDKLKISNIKQQFNILGTQSHLAQFIISKLNWTSPHFLDSILHRHVLFWVGEKYSQLLLNSKSFWSVNQDFQKFQAWFMKFIMMPISSRKYVILNCKIPKFGDLTNNSRTPAITIAELEVTYLKPLVPLSKVSSGPLDPYISYILLQVWQSLFYVKECRKLQWQTKIYTILMNLFLTYQGIILWKWQASICKRRHCVAL